MTSIESPQIESHESTPHLSKEVEKLTENVSKQVKTVLTVLESIKWEGWVIKSIKNMIAYAFWSDLRAEILNEEVIKERQKKQDEIDLKNENLNE